MTTKSSAAWLKMLREQTIDEISHEILNQLNPHIRGNELKHEYHQEIANIISAAITFGFMDSLHGQSDD